MSLIRHDHWPFCGIGWLGSVKLNMQFNNLEWLQDEVSDWLLLNDLGWYDGGSQWMAGTGVGLGADNFKWSVNIEFKLHVGFRVIRED